jgi:hypothetical protein
MWFGSRDASGITTEQPLTITRFFGNIKAVAKLELDES